MNFVFLHNINLYMKNNFFLILTILVGILLFSLVKIKKHNKKVIYPSDNPIERVNWEKIRLADPTTGLIPKDIYIKERVFAKTLPSYNFFSKSAWIHRGPFNVGGRTRALAFDILDDNILLAGGASGGMFRSLDAGQSWIMTTHPNQLHNVTCVTQDKRLGKENIWYFGSGELRGSSASGGGAYYRGNGIYKSIDGGLTWDSLPSTTSNTPHSFDDDFDFVWNIVTDPSNDSLDVVYAATYGSIYKSIDGGLNWIKEINGGSAYYNNVDITKNGVVYATVSSDGNNSAKGIWKCEDGSNWINITDSLFPPIYSRIAIGINPSNQNEVYFLAAETDGYGQHTDVFFGGETWTSLWKYNSLTSSWTDLSLNIPANNPTSFDNFNSQNSYDLLIKVHPSLPNVVFIGGTNLWRSSDGFTSKNNTDICGGYLVGSYEGDGNWGLYPNHHPDQHDLLFLPSNDSIMLSATDGGVYKSENSYSDTINWISLNNGYYTTQLYAATISRNANSDLLHGGFQDNGNFITFSANPLSHWNMPFNGDGAFAGIADNEQDFYLTIQRGVMYKMKLDSSANRLEFQRMDPASADTNKYLFINPMVMDDNSDIIYWAAGNHLWRNNDITNIQYNNSHSRSDQGWEKFSDTLSNPLMRITVIETSTNPPNIVYIGTKNKYVYRIDNANIGDPTINLINSNNITTGTNSFCSDIAINPLDANEIIVVYSNYSVYSLFHSNNGGLSFSKIAGNLEQNSSGSGNGPSCRTAEIIPLGNDTLYLVGTSIGLFGTSFLDGDNTIWKQIGKSTIGNVVIETLTYRPIDGRLIVATHGKGIYQINLSNIQNVLSTNYTKDINKVSLYPNPTSNHINIDLDLNKNSNVFYKIIDQLGRTVYKSNNNIFYKGKNSIKQEINFLSNGTYFIIIKVDEKTNTIQFIKN